MYASSEEVTLLIHSLDYSLQIDNICLVIGFRVLNANCGWFFLVYTAVDLMQSNHPIAQHIIKISYLNPKTAAELILESVISYLEQMSFCAQSYKQKVGGTYNSRILQFRQCSVASNDGNHQRARRPGLTPFVMTSLLQISKLSWRLVWRAGDFLQESGDQFLKKVLKSLDWSKFYTIRGLSSRTWRNTWSKKCGRFYWDKH